MTEDELTELLEEVRFRQERADAAIELLVQVIVLLREDVIDNPTTKGE